MRPGMWSQLIERATPPFVKYGQPLYYLSIQMLNHQQRTSYNVTADVYKYYS